MSLHEKLIDSSRALVSSPTKTIGQAEIDGGGGDDDDEKDAWSEQVHTWAF